MENLNRIKGALADAGKTGVWLASQLGKDPVTVGFQVVHKHHTIRFADAGKNFRTS